MATKLTEGEVRQRMKTAFGNPNQVGDNVLISAQGTGFKIVVWGYQLWNNADTAQTAVFRSGTNPLGPNIVMGVDAGGKTEYDVPPNKDVPVFECGDNQPLNINLAAATAVGVAVWWTIDRV